MFRDAARLEMSGATAGALRQRRKLRRVLPSDVRCIKVAVCCSSARSFWRCCWNALAALPTAQRPTFLKCRLHCSPNLLPHGTKFPAPLLERFGSAANGVAFYRRFISSPNFSSWFERRRQAAWACQVLGLSPLLHFGVLPFPAFLCLCLPSRIIVLPPAGCLPQPCTCCHALARAHSHMHVLIWMPRNTPYVASRVVYGVTFTIIIHYRRKYGRQPRQSGAWRAASPPTRTR